MKLRQHLAEYPASLKRQAHRSMVLAADWAVRNQIRDAWPAWDANKGRFPYHILIDPVKRAKKPMVWSTCWKTARAAQGMYSAYLVTGRKEYLESANLAMNYVGSLQYFEPGYGKFHGLFREDSPQGPHLAVRDSVEAAQGFINGYIVTGDKSYLRRAILCADWIWADFLAHPRAPTGIVWPREGRTLPYQPQVFIMYAAGALILAQLAKLTGRKDYIRRGAAPMMDIVLDTCLLDNGAFGYRGLGKVKTHHAGHSGLLNDVIVNDDGLGAGLLCTYAMTGKRKYLDAAVNCGRFWTETTGEPEMLAAYSSTSLFLSDLYRLTGDKRYVETIERYTARTIEGQCIELDDALIHGGYLGEDMAAHYDQQTVPTDYVDLRTTSYTLIAFAKIAAKRSSQWGCAYSCFGW